MHSFPVLQKDGLSSASSVPALKRAVQQANHEVTVLVHPFFYERTRGWRRKLEALLRADNRPLILMEHGPKIEGTLQQLSQCIDPERTCAVPTLSNDPHPQFSNHWNDPHYTDWRPLLRLLQDLDVRFAAVAGQYLYVDDVEDPLRPLRKGLVRYEHERTIAGENPSEYFLNGCVGFTIYALSECVHAEAAQVTHPDGIREISQADPLYTSRMSALVFEESEIH